MYSPGWYCLKPVCMCTLRSLVRYECTRSGSRRRGSRARFSFRKGNGVHLERRGGERVTAGLASELGFMDEVEALARSAGYRNPEKLRSFLGTIKKGAGEGHRHTPRLNRF